MGVILKIATLILAFFCLCVAASFSSRRGDILHLDHLQGNIKHKIICGSAGTDDPTKFSQVSGGRPRTVSSGDHNGGGSQPSGGAATIPLYTAGAAGSLANGRRNNHQNHNGSNRNRIGVEFLTLPFTIWAYLLLR